MEDPTTICVAPGARETGVPLITVVAPLASVDVVPPTVTTLPGARVWLPMTIAPEVFGMAVIVSEPTVTTIGAAPALVGWGCEGGMAIVEVPPTTTCVPDGSRTIGVPLITVVWPLGKVDVVPPMVMEEPGARV